MALGDYTGMLMQWILTPAIWLILIFVFLVGVFGILWLRKKRRLQFECLEIVDLNSRAGFNLIKCGYFGKRLWLGGLWWTGEEALITATGEIIHNFSTEDFQEINGKRGVVCYRDPIRQNILVPITKVGVKGKELLAAIAPADYTGVAVDIVRDAATETNDWKDKLIQFGTYAFIGIVLLITVIMVIQFVKGSQKEAAELLLQAGDRGIAACREIWTQAITTVGSNAP